MSCTTVSLNLAEVPFSKTRYCKFDVPFIFLLLQYTNFVFLYYIYGSLFFACGYSDLTPCNLCAFVFSKVDMYAKTL